MKTAGQIAYEAELAVVPTYHDGRPRSPWEKLATYEREQWEKNPTPRWTKGG